MRHGIELDETAVATLANAPTGGCLGCLWSVVLWPFRKVLKTVLIVFQVKAMADMASEVLHRALMLEEALELGWVLRDPDRVRVAMDKALVSVDTRVVERRLLGVFKDHSNDLNRVIWEVSQVARKDVGHRDHGAAVADALEADALGSGAREMTSAMMAALRGTGTVPELLAWFQAEMGEAPREVPGVVEPELLEVEPVERAALPAPTVEDAQVVDREEREE